MVTSLFTQEDCDFLKENEKTQIDGRQTPPKMQGIIDRFTTLRERIKESNEVVHVSRRGNKAITAAGTLKGALFEYFLPKKNYEEDQVFYNITLDAFGLHMKIDLKRKDGKEDGKYLANYNSSAEAQNIETTTSFHIEKSDLSKWSIDELINKFLIYSKDNITNLILFGKCIGSKYCEQKYESLMETIIQNLVVSNYNLILSGAPGTGKTYLAHKIAKAMGASRDNGQYEFVQFHPSYDYTDFVEGLRPEQYGNNVVFKRYDGIFKAFCRKAAEDTVLEHNYVFVIDEINRGEISKIFGELFFSIDPGYRGETDKETDNDNRVKTQYQNLIDNDDSLTDDKSKVKGKGGDKSKVEYYPFKKGFYVPSNVYVIGTMNDIDKSVESMDFAFRRRFAFYEVLAKETQDRILYPLKNQLKEEAKMRMDALNDAIYSEKQDKNCNLLEGFTAAYHIGAAYFKKIEKYGNNGWEKLWYNHIKGVLFEYLRGTPDASALLTQLKNIYDLKNADGSSK